MKIKLMHDPISDEEINKALTEPDYTLSSIEGRKIAVKKIGNRTVNVVYQDGKTHINVITVY